MARLSKSALKNSQNFTFKEEEVEVPGVPDDNGEPGTVLVRTPDVGTRDRLAKERPEDPKDWELEDTARLFAAIVVDPKVTQEEAVEILRPWPGEALDAILEKFNELTGSDGKERDGKMDAVGDFPGEES